MTSYAQSAHRVGLKGRWNLTSGIMLPAGILASFAAASTASGWQHQAVLLLGLLVLTLIAFLDIRTLRARNRIVYPASLALILAFATLGLGPVIHAVTAGFLAFILLLLCVIFGRGSMGYGDAKVGFICGSLVGIGGVLPMLLSTFFVGGCFAALALTLGRKSRRDVIAFTPFLLVGVLLSSWVSSSDWRAWFV